MQNAPHHNDGGLIIQTIFKAILAIILINHANGASGKVKYKTTKRIIMQGRIDIAFYRKPYCSGCLGTT